MGVPGDFGDGQSRSFRTSEAACLVTVSYRGDLELARELCTSVDRFADPEIEHVLVVPRSDVSIFMPLATGGRRLLAVEDIIPSGYTRLPLPYQVSLGPLYKRTIRDVWRGPRGLVRGWIVQQILKLSAPAITPRDVIVFADSDIVLLRNLLRSAFTEGHGTRLYRVPGATRDSAMHRKWHAVSARLLGLDNRDYFGADYIGHLVTWRRDIILQLQSRLATVGGERWDKVVARERAFSEYILYGIFAEHVLGLSQCEHVPTSQDLVHASWHYELTTPAGLSDFASGLAPHHVAAAIQSTQDFTIEERRRLIRRMLHSI